MAWPDEAKGTCFSRGFVGKRLRAHPQVLLEAVAGDRASGSLWQGNNQPASPWCIKERPDFIADVAEAIDPVGVPQPFEVYQSNTVSLLLKERNCPEWMEYSPFHDPARHVQEERVIDLEERRRLWQKDFEDDRRRWWDEYDLRKITDETKWNTRFEGLSKAQVKLGWGGLVIGVVALLVAIVALANGGGDSPIASPQPSPAIATTQR